MKKISVLFAALLAISLAGFGFVSCSDDDDDDGSSVTADKAGNNSSERDDDDDGGSSVTATLPANVGTNEFKEKTWTGSSSDGSTTLAFTDSTLKMTDSEGVYNFKYAYNSTEKLLYRTRTSQVLGTTTVSSVSDYVNYEKSKKTTEGETWTSGMNEYYTADATAEYKTPMIHSYSIDGTSLKLSNKCYFDGTLPSCASFQKSFDSGYTITIENKSRIKIMKSDGKNRYYIWPTYSNGSFSGNVFNSDYDTVGTISGTYTTSGKGLTGGTVTLKFTSLPSAILNTISGISTNTEYALSQDDGSSYTTFTQQ